MLAQEEFIRDANDIPYSKLRRFYRHWRLLKDKYHNLPTPTDFGIETISDLINYSALLGFSQEKDSFFYRRVGAGLNEMAGQDLKGVFVNTLDQGEAINTQCKKTIEQQTPLFVEQQAMNCSVKQHRQYAGLAAPLITAKSTKPDHVMFVCEVFE